MLNIMAAKSTVWDDHLAARYRELGEHPLNKALELTVLHYSGIIHGQSVLDVGCGDGRFCRLVKSKGAFYVLGVDISPGMINAARLNDETSGRSCNYQTGNACSLGKIGEFDLVSSIGLLPYAETISELTDMASNFYQNLKVGGRCVSIGLNCLEDSDFIGTVAHYKLGTVTMLPPKGEAKRLKFMGKAHDKDHHTFTATLFYFEPHTYLRVFEDVGFRNFEFMPIVLHAENINSHAEGYWDVYISNPIHLCYVAEK